MFLIKAIYWLGKRYSRYGLYGYIKTCCKEISLGNNNILFVGSGGELQAVVESHLTSLNRITSIDLDESRNPDLVMDITNLHFEKNSFDYVFMLEVLEHVSEPTLAMSELHRCLRPGGKLFMSTPFVFGIHDAPYDYFRYTKYGLLHLARKFKDIEIKERNNYVFTVCVLLIRLIMGRTIINKFIGLFFLIVISALLPFIFILGCFVTSDQITTGYTTTCVKKA
jgi:SAM-dependent methyltransferase